MWPPSQAPLTPSEVIASWKAGADFVKIYPCAQVGGDQYIRALKGQVAADKTDRFRRRQSTDRGQLYLRRRGIPGHWIGADATSGAQDAQGQESIRELARRIFGGGWQ